MNETAKYIAEISSASLKILGIGAIVLFAVFTTISALVETIMKHKNQISKKKSYIKNIAISLAGVS